MTSNSGKGRFTVMSHGVRKPVQDNAPRKSQNWRARSNGLAWEGLQKFSNPWIPKRHANYKTSCFPNGAQIDRRASFETLFMLSVWAPKFDRNRIPLRFFLGWAATNRNTEMTSLIRCGRTCTVALHQYCATSIILRSWYRLVVVVHSSDLPPSPGSCFLVKKKKSHMRSIVS